MAQVRVATILEVQGRVRVRPLSGQVALTGYQSRQTAVASSSRGPERYSVTALVRRRTNSTGGRSADGAPFARR